MKSPTIPSQTQPPGRSRWLSWLTTTATILGLSASAMAQTTILATQPGGGPLPAGWTGENNITTNAIDRGTYWLVDAGSPGDYIISESYDLTAFSSVTIDVNVATFGSGTNNPLRIEFSTDGGTSWSPTTFTTATPTSNTYIAGGPVMIAQTFSATTKLRFSAGGTSGRGVRIQQLGITGSSPGGDTTPPAILSLSPTNTAVDVPVDTDLTITFNEPIQAGTGNIVLYDSADNVVDTFSVSDPEISFPSPSSLTINPDADLAFSTGYYVLIDSGAITDTATVPNAFPGILTNATWAFATIGPDIVGPVPTTFEPASGASNIPVDFLDLNTTGAAFVTFNEPVTLVGTLPVEIRRVSDDALIEEIPADDFSSMFVGGANGEELGMFVFEILDFSTEYYISVPAGTVQDASGNPNLAFGAPASSTPWTFTTFGVAAIQDAIPYTQDFAGFTGEGTLPTGWFAEGPVLGYTDDWGLGFSSGFRGNASVLGYQHTSSTGVLIKGLRLRNDTGAEITDLTISYDGRAERLAEDRSPAYVVAVDGVAVPALAYSTAEGDGVTKSASISGLTIAAGASFEITWTSDRDLTASGSSKQIGISNVSVSNTAALLPPTLGVTSVVIGSVTDTGLEVDGDLIADGGAAITARGFVISETSVNAAPEIGGTGVTTLPDAATDLGAFSATISGLSPSTQYSISAYATNSQGTAYSNIVTATTLTAPPSFLGELIENFNGFDGTLANGWTALSSTGANSYAGVWGTGTGAGLRGGVSSPGVLGYQHTSGTGIFTVTLRLKNDTGSTLDQLFIHYLGRVERATESRTPAWTVKLNGTEVTELAYSTASGVDETKSHMITGLSIANGETFTITWESDRGLPSGSSRQIGIANVVVNLDGTLPPPADDFDAWVSGFTGMGSLTGFYDDADFDGIVNGLEHVLGLAPNSADQGSQLAVASSGANSLTIRHTRIKPADLGSDVLPVYEWSADLATWSGSAVTFNGVTVTFGAPVVVDDTDPDFDVVDVTATITGGSSTKVFVRLGAEQSIP